jgi:hypothetical protein
VTKASAHIPVRELCFPYNYTVDVFLSSLSSHYGLPFSAASCSVDGRTLNRQESLNSIVDNPINFTVTSYRRLPFSLNRRFKFASFPDTATIHDLILYLQAKAFSSSDPVFDLRVLSDGVALDPNDSISGIPVQTCLYIETDRQWESDTISVVIRFPGRGPSKSKYMYPKASILPFVRSCIALSHNLPYDQIALTSDSHPNSILNNATITVAGHQIMK